MAAKGPHAKALRTRLYESPVVALGAGEIEMEVDSCDLRHWFAGVEWYDDVAGEAGDVVTPTAGSSTFTVKTPLIPLLDQAIPGNVVNYAVNDEQVSFATNILSMKVTFAGITGAATHARLRVMGNPS